MRASALLIPLSVVAGVEATTGQATVTLVGTTLDSATLQPIPAVSVYTTTTVRTDFTDASGAFRLADLPQEHISSPCVEVAIGSLPGNAPSESPLRFFATLFALLGTPPADKRWVLFPLGHLPPIDETARETLDWLDRYLGPVGRGDSRLEILENRD